MTARIATPADDALLYSIVMHPDVRRWTACDGAADFDPRLYTAHPKSFAVLVDSGCFLAPALEQGAYAVHTNILPDARGTRAIRSGQEAMSLAFLSTDAQSLMSWVPASSRHALWFAHAMGFRDTFLREKMWLWGGSRYAMQFVRLDIDDWILQSDACRTAGEAFHCRLAGHVEHDPDPVHDAYVGAAWMMMSAGQTAKAQQVYGRWGRAAGYQPFEVLSLDPFVIDIGTCVLRMVEGEFQIEEKMHA